MTGATSSRRTRAPAFDLDAYQRGLEAFSAEVGEARWAVLSGQSPRLELAPAYRGHADLFSRQAVEALRVAATADGEQASQARVLLAFASEGCADNSVVELSDQIEAAEASAIVIWRGERIAYRRVPARIAEISERSDRNALDASYREAVEAINPLREERFRRLQAAANELGHGDPLAMVGATRGLDLHSLAAEMQRFLVESETPYFSALRRYLAEIDIELGDASAADLSHLLRGSGWDGWFEERRLLPVLRRTLAGLGLDLAAQPNLLLEVEAGPDGAGDAVCLPLRIPQDVRLVLGGGRGHAAYNAALAALGQAEFYVNAAAELPAASRYVGDDSVGTGYGYVFANLMLEPDWLEGELGMAEGEISGWLDFAAFGQLHRLRRAAAGLLYELRLYGSGQTAQQRAYYAGLLGLLTGVRHPEPSYLADVADHLALARDLRGQFLATALGDWLRLQHGAVWWRSETSGAELRRGWSRGQPENAETLVAHLGYHHLDWRPVLRQIRTQLIGEMSGYGGPNITTRAGTRKV